MKTNVSQKGTFTHFFCFPLIFGKLHKRKEAILDLTLHDAIWQQFMFRFRESVGGLIELCSYVNARLQLVFEM